MEAQETVVPTAPVVRSEPWRSEEIGELCLALAQCQAEIKNPKKGRTAKVRSKKGEDSSFSYAYADISDVVEAINAVAPKFGLSHSQIIRPNAEGKTCIFTLVMHKSNQWMLGEYKLPTASDNHEMGGNITYGRRYALAPMFGIASEEDSDFKSGHKEDDEADKEKSAAAAHETAEKFRSGKFRKLKPGEDVLKSEAAPAEAAETAAAAPAEPKAEAVAAAPADDPPPAKTALAARLEAAKAKAEKKRQAAQAEETAERQAIQDTEAGKPAAVSGQPDYTGIHEGLAKKLQAYEDGKNDPVAAFDSYVRNSGILGSDYDGGVAGLPVDFVEQVLAQWKKVEPKFIEAMKTPF